MFTRNKIFWMAIIMSIIGFAGLMKYPTEIDKFMGFIGMIWTGFVGAQLDMKKDG